MSALFRTWPERAPAALDIGLLPIRDRACLRLLDRYESATADQLAILVHPTLRTSQRRLRRLWRLGLLERSPLMPERGGIPMARTTAPPIRAPTQWRQGSRPTRG